MAQSITITINDDLDAIELLDKFCYRMNYREQIPNPDFDPQLEIDPITNPQEIDNPKSKKNFWKEKVIEWSLGNAIAGEEKLLKQTNINKYTSMNIS